MEKNEKISSLKMLKGNIFTDDRGTVTFVNDFNFAHVKRFYQVHNHRSYFIRAWHGHKNEGKYVYVVKGTALVGAVNLDTEEISKYIISAEDPKILWIPPNYANGFMNLCQETIIQFFSTSTVEESKNDDIRLPWDKWNIWNIEYR
jgi:dTDP-4-dehydrorhamnose 3,5-epimerase